MFKQIDTDGNGTIDKAEFKTFCNQLDEDLTDEMIANDWKELDTNEDGHISIEELWMFFKDRMD